MGRARPAARRAAQGVAFALAWAAWGCGARDGLLVGGGASANTPPDDVPPDTAGACDELLWPGASVPIAGYCMDRAKRSSVEAPNAPRLSWSMNTPWSRLPTLVVDHLGRIFAPARLSELDEARALSAYGPDGTLLWNLGLGGPLRGGPVLTRQRTILILYEVMGSYFAQHVDRDGNVVAEYPLPATTGQFNLLGVGANTTLYFSEHTSRTKIVATDREARPLWWSDSFDSISAVALDSRGNLVFQGGSEVVSVDRNGVTRWASSPTSSSGFYSLSIGPDDRTYVFTSGPLRELYLYVLSQDGELLQTRLFSELRRYSAHALAPDGSAYVVTEQGVTRIDATGTQGWTYPKPPDANPDLVVDGRGRVLVMPDLVLLEPETGNVLWRVDVPVRTGGEVPARLEPGVLGKHGVVLGDTGGALYCVR